LFVSLIGSGIIFLCHYLLQIIWRIIQICFFLSWEAQGLDLLSPNDFFNLSWKKMIIQIDLLYKLSWSFVKIFGSEIFHQELSYNRRQDSINPTLFGPKWLTRNFYHPHRTKTNFPKKFHLQYTKLALYLPFKILYSWETLLET